MKTSELTPQQRQIRINVRNFLLVATPKELQKELEISSERGDKFRASCVQELIDESVKGSQICGTCGQAIATA